MVVFACVVIAGVEPGEFVCPPMNLKFFELIALAGLGWAGATGRLCMVSGMVSGLSLGGLWMVSGWSLGDLWLISG